MSPDICKVKNMLREERIWNAVKMHMDNYQRSKVGILKSAGTFFDLVFVVNLRNSS
jgi:hypothetical protein